MSNELNPQKLTATTPPHSSYFFLSTPHPPISSDVFESRYSTPLQKELQLKLGIKLGGKFGFYYTEGQSPQENKLMGYSGNGKLIIPNVRTQSVDTMVETIEQFITSPSATPPIGEEIDVFICTHMARDCRCGEKGGEFYHALKQAIQSAGEQQRIRIHHCAHVGGHHLAPNILIYPQGEWLSSLAPTQIPELLDALRDSPIRPFTDLDRPIMPAHWRGRMGLTKVRMTDLFEKYFGPSTKED